jgi:hypothetical protein
MKKLLESLSLRDPIWQAIGAIIAIAALIISLFVTYDIYQRSARPSELAISKEFWQYRKSNPVTK